MPMIWNGIGMTIQNSVGGAMKAAKEKKTKFFVIAAIIAVGVFLFLRGK